jgi:anti-sigma factor RsiW
MKPCFRKRKLIAWLVLDHLETEEVRALREHLEACEGCRKYFDELSHLTGTLRTASWEPDLNATASFHQKVMARVNPDASLSVRGGLPEVIRGLLNWRVALPLAGAAVVLGIMLAVLPRGQTPMHPKSGAQASISPHIEGDLDPTLANYQMAANQSLEKLDEILTAQGNRKLPPAPIYTVAMSGAARGPN